MSESRIPLVPGLTEAVIHQRAGSTIVSRGEAYMRQNAVADVVLRGEMLTAAVHGSEYEPYQVIVRFDAGGVTNTECSCPFDQGGWCKHIVATLLLTLRQPDEVGLRPPLAMQLAPLDQAQLVALLEHVAEDPTVAAQIERHLMLGQARATSSTTASRHIQVDPAPVQARLHQLFNPRGRDHDYDHDQTILSEVEQLLAQIGGFVEHGDGINALRLLEALTTEYVEHWFDYDREGELSSQLDHIGHTWAEALLTADLSPDALHEWAERLEQWADEADNYDGGDGLRLAAAAAAQGWAEPSIQAALSGELNNLTIVGTSPSITATDDEGDEWEDEHDEPDEQQRLPSRLPPEAARYITPARMLIHIRLRILDRQKRDDAYLNLANATGEHALHAAKLAQLGRTTEAVADSLLNLAFAPEALVVAQALRQQGAYDEALRIGEFGLTLDGPIVDLGEWLIPLATARGRHDLALQAARIAFEATPTLARYERLHDMAGASDWPPLRIALLDHLRETSASWQNVSARIDIFLSENQIDDAITVAEPFSSENDMARVADAALLQRPEWVIRTGRKRANAIIEAGKASNYDTATAWLRRVRDASHAAGRTTEWSSYISEVHASHGRKYKLMSLIQGL